MKTKTIIFGLAFAAMAFTSITSCSPQSIDDTHAEQNIDKTKIKVPTHG